MDEERGNVNERHEACVFVEFENGTKVEFLIDTGFDGHLCLPRSAMDELNLQAVTSTFIYGIGNHTEILEVGKVDVIWCNKKLPNIEFLINEGEDFLLGTALLEDKELYINYKTNEVLITQTL
jgi:clan AA aspartic protease